MSDNLPEYLKQGEVSRLFPVLSTTSKEGRTTAILLSCLTRIDEFGAGLLNSVGQRVGKRAKVTTYTEVVFKKQNVKIKDKRPDGLIVVKVGNREWRALIEAKIGNSELEFEQIEHYRTLAKENSIDCVITISNQFASKPNHHPVESVRKSRSRIPVFHWSWMHILTVAGLLISQKQISDPDQLFLLNELRRFLSHESAGVRGFDRMPREWADINKLVSTGGAIPSRSTDAAVVLDAWHQETRDLSLVLSRLLERNVSEKLPRKHLIDGAKRQKDDCEQLRNSFQLKSILDVPDAAAPLEVVADMRRRSIEVSMSLRAPEDKRTTKARLNWVLRQIKNMDNDDLYVRLHWPGKSDPTQFPLSDLLQDSDIAEQDKSHLCVHKFDVFSSTRIGSRFGQRANFIADLERLVPNFYKDIGSNLVIWKSAAPKMKSKKTDADDVSPEAIFEDAEEFVFDLSPPK